MHLKLDRPLAFLDLETTGINTQKDRIVEMAIVKLMPDGERVRKEFLINPTIPIPQQATDVHGISNEDVKDKPTFADVANEIKQFIDSCDIAGFNSNRFDIPLLNEEFLRVKIDPEFKQRSLIDVQAIFHKKEPRDLTAAYKFYCDQNLEDAHSALADTEATADVLLAQIERYDDLSRNVTGLASYSEHSQYLDYARRIIVEDDTPVFNFGKHKGTAVTEVFAKEPQYYDWIMKSDFAQDTKNELSKLYTQFKLKGQ